MLVLFKHAIYYKYSEAIAVVIIWWLDLQLPMQSVHITTKVVSSNPTQAGYAQ